MVRLLVTWANLALLEVLSITFDSIFWMLPYIFFVVVSSISIQIDNDIISL